MRTIKGDLGTTSSGKGIPDVNSGVYGRVYGSISGRRGGHYALRRKLPNWTKIDHLEAADLHESEENLLRDEHARAIYAAEKKYGDDGALISGGFREHWPSSVKDKIRKLAHTYPLHGDAAALHRAAARFRSH